MTMFFFSNSTNVQILFDFTRLGLDNALTTWTENSDTAKSTGTSKAALVVQKSQVFQRAVLFTLLNPKKNGAEYAAVQCDTSFNIGDYNNICLRCRAQGANVNYKMLLRHKNLDKNSLIYGQVFTVNILSIYQTIRKCGASFPLKGVHCSKKLYI